MGRPKAGVVLPGGETFAERMARVLSEVCPEIVLLGHGVGASESLERLPDPPGLQGPVAGVMALLRSHRADAFLVVPVDMPSLRPEMLRALLPDAAAADASPTRTCAAVFGPPTGDLDRRLLFPVWLHACALEHADAWLDANRSAALDPLCGASPRAPSWRALLSALSPRRVAPPADAGDAFHNVNTPHDLLRPD